MTLAGAIPARSARVGVSVHRSEQRLLVRRLHFHRRLFLGMSQPDKAQEKQQAERQMANAPPFISVVRPEEVVPLTNARAGRPGQARCLGEGVTL